MTSGLSRPRFTRAVASYRGCASMTTTNAPATVNTGQRAMSSRRAQMIRANWIMFTDVLRTSKESFADVDDVPDHDRVIELEFHHRSVAGDGEAILVAVFADPAGPGD